MTTSRSDQAASAGGEAPWKPLMTAEQHRRQAELLLRRGGEENGERALNHERLANIIEAREAAQEGAEDAWNEADHPRGQPGNAGQFGSGGGGGGKKEAPAAAPDPNQLEMVLEPKFRTKTEHVKHLLSKEGGTTVAEVLKATGWPSVSMPQMARVLGLRLEKIKEGGQTKYKGVPLTEAEKAEAKKAASEAKEAKRAEAERVERERVEAERKAQEEKTKKEAWERLLKEEAAKRKRDEQKAKRAAKKKAAEATGTVKIQATPKTSEAYKKSISDALNKLPEGVRKAVEANGSYFLLGETMTEANPDLRGPRTTNEADKRTSWDESGGCYSWGDKAITMSEKRMIRTAGGTKELYLKDGPRRHEVVVHHEMGHAYDHALGNRKYPHGAYSQSPEFQAAYKADIAKLNKFQQSTLGYYLQKPPIGAMEAFAEVFACIHANGGKGGNGSGGTDVRGAFANVTKLMAPIAHG